MRALTARLLTAGALTLAASSSLCAQQPDGAGVFAQSCLMCHQSGGAGLPGQFPRLAGRVVQISAKAQGRAYLIDLLTYGMTGTIKVDGQDILGLMPSFAQLSDADVALVLNYAQSLGQQPSKAPAAFSAEEVRSARSRPPKNAAEVHAERQTLGLDKLKP